MRTRASGPHRRAIRPRWSASSGENTSENRRGPPPPAERRRRRPAQSGAILALRSKPCGSHGGGDIHGPDGFTSHIHRINVLQKVLPPLNVPQTPTPSAAGQLPADEGPTRERELPCRRCVDRPSPANRCPSIRAIRGDWNRHLRCNCRQMRHPHERPAGNVP